MIHVIFQVLEIQKLAAELGLKCITTYKLDALKSVQRINKSDNQDATQGGVNGSIQNSELPKSGLEKVSDTVLGFSQGELFSRCRWCFVIVVQILFFLFPSPCLSLWLRGRGDTLSFNSVMFWWSCCLYTQKFWHVIAFHPSWLDKVATFDQPKNGKYTSNAEHRKNMRVMRNGPGRNNTSGGRVEKCKGFFPNTFDRVLLDAPCSALGLRPRLFSGEVWSGSEFVSYDLIVLSSCILKVEASFTLFFFYKLAVHLCHW